MIKLPPLPSGKSFLKMLLLVREQDAKDYWLWNGQDRLDQATPGLYWLGAKRQIFCVEQSMQMEFMYSLLQNELWHYTHYVWKVQFRRPIIRADALIFLMWYNSLPFISEGGERNLLTRLSQDADRADLPFTICGVRSNVLE